MHFKCHLLVISYLKGRSRVVQKFFITGGLIRTIFEHNINIKTATGHARIPFALSLSKGDRNVGKLTNGRVCGSSSCFKAFLSEAEGLGTNCFYTPELRFLGLGWCKAVYYHPELSRNNLSRYRRQ